MNDQNISWNQLVRYLGGGISTAEREKVQQWMAADPKNTAFVHYMKQIWENSAKEEKEQWDVDVAWSRFQAEYGEKLQDRKAKPFNRSEQQASRMHWQSYINNKRRARNSWLVRGGSIAASIAAIIIIVFVAFHPMREQPQKPAMQHIVCPDGQKVHYHLSDGSQIILNGGSKLTMPKTFSGAYRRVKLSGEAYFVIVHNPRRPFIVDTKYSEIRDLGTRFDVKAYPNAKSTQVVVIEGKINFRSKEDSMGAGVKITSLHKGVLRKNGLQLSAIKDSSTYTAWTNGKLIFINDPLREVAKRLQRWYGLKVKVRSTNLYEKKFTGKFTSHQSLSEVLDAIALSLNMHYIKQDSSIIFYNDNR
jgi:ferric-dicitrate binding protein FerR (iron transport regulator)